MNSKHMILGLAFIAPFAVAAQVFECAGPDLPSVISIEEDQLSFRPKTGATVSRSLGILVSAFYLVPVAPNEYIMVDRSSKNVEGVTYCHGSECAVCAETK